MIQNNLIDSNWNDLMELDLNQIALNDLNEIRQFLTFKACAITDEENEYNIQSKEAKNQLNIEKNTSNTTNSIIVNTK
ncbi:hypothetical protein C2G38_2231391 [Gigaspora rosea]|uniref:Uncharacterized protein n=1 Tax=Gigaspora rosea TaxID=44941 RepID=A0A397U2G1_9GLOM|nr:hypothetical protein C2G38_2231391 [Gigaspora rosea]